MHKLFNVYRKLFLNISNPNLKKNYCSYIQYKIFKIDLINIFNHFIAVNFDFFLFSFEQENNHILKIFVFVYKHCNIIEQSLFLKFNYKITTKVRYEKR